jgi:hypothetical protein
MVFAVKSKTGRVNLSTQWRDLHIPTTNGESALPQTVRVRDQVKQDLERGGRVSENQLIDCSGGRDGAGPSGQDVLMYGVYPRTPEVPHEPSRRRYSHCM